MSRPGYRSSIATPRQPRETMTVDYKDVLEQVVVNERWRVVRELRTLIEGVSETKKSPNDSWRYEQRRADEFKRDVLSGLARMEAAV